MLLPSVFGDRLFSGWEPFDRDFFDISRPVLHRSSLMKTDIRESGDSYELQIDLPGFDKEDIDIELDKGYLNVSAHRRSQQEEDSAGFIRRERYAGSCSRSFFVGEDVSEEQISARMENGILKLCLPKKEECKEPEARKIMIQ